MTLPSTKRIDILREAKHDADSHAEVWLDIANYLENEIAKEIWNEPVFIGDTRTDADGVQFNYTSNQRQGDYLPRDGKRDKPLRYHRGSKASDEGPL